LPLEDVIMNRNARPKAKKKRAPKGAGQLYKRDAAGVDHPADWQGSGSYWLGYSLPNPNGGRGQRIREPLRDATGEPITDRQAAEAERKRILAPYQTGNKAETLKAVVARLTDAETAHGQAVEDATPPLRIADTWKAYLNAPERPDSGEVTQDQYDGHWRRFSTWLATNHPEAADLRDITPSLAAEYATHLADSRLSPNRFNKHRRVSCGCSFRVLSDAARITDEPLRRRSSARCSGRTAGGS
jgi:hypothetical protein